MYRKSIYQVRFTENTNEFLKYQEQVFRLSTEGDCLKYEIF